MFGFHKKNTFPMRKGMKMLIVILSVTWLGVLAVNLSPDQIAQTSVLDAEGNVVGEEFTLTTEDLQALGERSGEWNESDAHFKARSLAENGIQAFNQGDFENAIDLYNQALELGAFEGENQLTLLANLAIAYESYGDSTNALSTYKRMQAMVDSKSALFHVITGKIALVDEFVNVNDAVKEFEWAIDIEPENFDANNALALIYMGEYGSEYIDFEKALVYNQKTRAIQSENTNVMLNLSINYIGLGQYENAVMLLSEVLELMPHSLPANYLMMRAHYLSGDAVLAKEYASKLLGWHPGFKDDKLVAEILGN